MRGDELLDKMGLTDPAYVEAADRRPGLWSRGWVRWGAAAACLCLVAAALLWPRGPQIAVKEVDSLEELSSASGGGLLAGRLTAAGARTTSIRLCYAKGGDASDPAAWDSLSVSGDYNGQDFTLDCDFDGAERENPPENAFETVRYGDVEAAVYRESVDWSDDQYLYRAEFTLDGVAYEMSTYAGGPEAIRACLDLVLGEPESGAAQSGAVMPGVLGFDVCRIEMEDLGTGQYEWHYYVEMDGEDVCVAEQFGYDGPESWSRDLDGDGVPELICNCTWGDGAQLVTVYRNRSGVIEEGRITWDWYGKEFGWTHIGEGGISSLPVERYDPERNVFTATDYYTRGYDDPVTKEFPATLEPFGFSPFKHLE